MTVLELNELVEACEEEFGYQQSSSSSCWWQREGGATEQTEFT